MTSKNPLHLSSSPERYTPELYIEAARQVMGSIDLDPASCEISNTIVKADTYYTQEDDGLVQDWFGNVFINPPGDKRGKLPKLFWKRLTEQFLSGKVNNAIWLGFSLSQLATLQKVIGAPGPASWPLCFTKKRIKFLQDVEGELVEMKQPTHDNFFCLWTRQVAVAQRFKRVFGEKVGQVVLPDNLPVTMSYPQSIITNVESI